MNYLKIFAVFIFDLIDKYIHQKNILDSIKKEKIKIATFIDIGAHKGKYTDLISNYYKIKKIYMFEPQTKMLKYLKKKYKKERKKIFIYNYGVSNKSEIRSFYINRHDLTSSIKKLNPKNKYLNLKSKLFGTNLKGMIQEKLNIKTIKLKEFLLKKKIKRIDLIKIDTEGHELEVLIGLGNKIKIVKSFLIEFHDNNTYINYNNKKIEKLLKINNFLLKKKIKFPFTTWEDRLYLNNN
jgi:FkbM family methyltransferase